jgi:hypothetical protein
MSFLEVITRHMESRPNFIQDNFASLDMQTCDDWVQTLLVDDVGRGVEWANYQMGRYAPNLVGEFIWVLDDDDVCVCETFVEDMKRIVEEHDPDVIISKIDANGVIPPDELWRKKPKVARIGMACFVVRRAVWQAHAEKFWPKLAADYNFIFDVWAAGVYKWYWHDEVVMRIQQVGRGRPE